MNEAGKPVDWFIIYKLPYDSSPYNRKLKGRGYLYMDGSTNGQWTRSNLGLDNDKQSVGYTYAQIYATKKDPNVFRAMYNDEWPSGDTSFTLGHTKGAAAFDKTSGFWMIHSVPKFPHGDAYSYPSTGAKYGQAFLCVTYKYAQLGDVGKQLFFNEPYIYEKALPAAFAKDFPVLDQLIKGEATPSPFSNTATLVSSGGVSLISFAKSKKWGHELYADLVAPTLKKNLIAETWQNGKGNTGKNCSLSYHVTNAAQISLADDITFSILDDHSKWAVSDEKSGGFICIGDINRQFGQIRRGGGTVCMQDAKVWKAFRNSIKKSDSC